ncbi:MAG: hypothetical protein KF760_15680 [Candidatus Eremiobacteraeota bacterium]|nr:hypothetical protein [Candidatus Eremiobacteraeota bacterium]MCW5870564.1 hypothetical protein [Candidatus Eremiobacteraeota bacterium]
MSVVKNSSGVISIPSESNNDLGLFLVFLGLALSFPVRALLDRVYPEQAWVGISAPAGVVLVVFGFILIRYTRKRFWLDGKSVRVKDGWLKRSLRYSWEDEPMIRLRSQEEERGPNTLEFWLVNLVDGKRQYVLDRRVGHHIESRSLAEALAKSINCPVLEKAEHGEILIPREELDLPFRERVRKQPELLGGEASKPDPCPIECDEDENSQRYTWRLLSPAMLNEFFTLVLFVFLLAVVPIFPKVISGEETAERFQLSFLDIARTQHQFLYFYVSGGIVAVTAFFLFGYGKELKAGRQSLDACDRLWGFPVYKASIPADQLEEIWVRQSARGAHLQLISDACIITGRTSNSAAAVWLASRLRRFYAT